MFVTITHIYHSVKQVTIPPGTIVALEHLNEQEIKRVIAAGGVMPEGELASLADIPGVGKERAMQIIATLGVHHREGLAVLPIGEIAKALGLSMQEAADIRTGAAQPFKPKPLKAEKAAESPAPAK